MVPTFCLIDFFYTAFSKTLNLVVIFIFELLDIMRHMLLHFWTVLNKSDLSPCFVCFSVPLNLQTTSSFLKVTDVPPVLQVCMDLKVT